MLLEKQFKKKTNFFGKTPKNIFRYSGVGKISKFPLFCRILLKEKLVIRKLSAIAGFSAKLKFTIAGFNCNRRFRNDFFGSETMPFRIFMFGFSKTTKMYHNHEMFKIRNYFCFSLQKILCFD